MTRVVTKQGKTLNLKGKIVDNIPELLKSIYNKSWIICHDNNIAIRVDDISSIELID